MSKPFPPFLTGAEVRARVSAVKAKKDSALRLGQAVSLAWDLPIELERAIWESDDFVFVSQTVFTMLRTDKE